MMSCLLGLIVRSNANCVTWWPWASARGSKTGRFPPGTSN